MLIAIAYFCMSLVLSVHICFNVKCQLCFRERSGMRRVHLQQNDNVRLKRLRAKFTPLPQIGLEVVLNYQLHSAKLSSIYTNQQVIRGAINFRTCHINQRPINSFVQLSSLLYSSAFVQSVMLKTLLCLFALSSSFC